MFWKILTLVIKILKTLKGILLLSLDLGYPPSRPPANLTGFWPKWNGFSLGIQFRSRGILCRWSDQHPAYGRCCWGFMKINCALCSIITVDLLGPVKRSKCPALVLVLIVVLSGIWARGNPASSPFRPYVCECENGWMCLTLTRLWMRFCNC